MKKSKKERVTELLDLPKEVLLDTPKLTVYSDNQLTVENYGGILEYTDCYIRLKTAGKTIAVSGRGLELRAITDVDVLVEGSISRIDYLTV
ncbi:MAG: sporulation protein YqfC [Clostridiales bacterium]|jgi:sporulation protein YqfC|nr:sporulation protein YqfC [Clostridiales bacterium]